MSTSKLLSQVPQLASGAPDSTARFPFVSPTGAVSTIRYDQLASALRTQMLDGHVWFAMHASTSANAAYCHNYTPSSVTLSASTMSKIMGVSIWDGEKMLIIAPEIKSGCHFSNATTRVTSGKTLLEAKRDMSGRETFNAICAHPDYAADITNTDLAIGWARQYSHSVTADGKTYTRPAGKWWIPSAGECLAIIRHAPYITAAMALIGGPSFAGKSATSTTEASESSFHDRVCAIMSSSDAPFFIKKTDSESNAYNNAFCVTSYY